MAMNRVKDQYARYQNRSRQLGLDPELHAGGHNAVSLAIHGVEKMRELAAVPISDADRIQSPIDAGKILSMEPGLARQALLNHIFGHKQLSTAAIAAAEQRFRFMPLMVYQAPDIVVSAQSPLIISSVSSIVNYGTVTIKDGGYIDISVDCNFTCDVLEKIAGDGAAPFDLMIRGVDGNAGNSPPAKGKANNGSPGSSAACDCCGGTIAQQAGPGATGQSGVSGDDAGVGQPGATGPMVNITIGHLIGTVTVAARGGNGGPGGVGGTGGIGGDGGAGGSGATCGAFYANAGDGGNGGLGGRGGSAANGGQGGNGGVTRIDYITVDPYSQFVANNQVGAGGLKGKPGYGGDGGQGGRPGGGGGRMGNNGTRGDMGNDQAINGADGQLGILLINGQPAG
jgi:hypothetical protein